MNNFKRQIFLGIIGIFLTGTINLWAGIPDTIKVDEVSVVASRLNHFTTGSNIYRISAKDIELNANQSIADLLAQESTVQVNAYGPGGLSNISIRGGNSYHTAVLFQGINLQNPMNGGVNMANIPVNFVDNIHIQCGGSGTLFGSGAVTGVVHLNNQLELNKGFQLKTVDKLNSFGNFSHGNNLLFSSKKMAFAVRYFMEEAKNSYKYQNNYLFQPQTLTMKGAEGSQQGLMLESLLQINEYNSFEVSGWYQSSFKELQPFLTDVGDNTANQKDDLANLYISYKYQKKRLALKINTSYNHQEYLFEPHYKQLENGFGKVGQFKTELEASYRLADNQFFFFSVEENYEMANSVNYEGDESRNRISFVGSYKHYELLDALTAVLSLRKELNSFGPVDWLYSAGLETKPFAGIIFKSHYSSTYRVPTLNDLSWHQPGMAIGNPNLVPEQGHTFDFGLANNRVSGQTSRQTSISFYHTNISNQLTWYLNDRIWTVQNLPEVSTKGLEINNQQQFAIFNTDVSFVLKYTYADARLLKASNPEDVRLDKQMEYIPKHKAHAGLTVSANNFDVYYKHGFTSERWFDHSLKKGYMDAYHLAEAGAGYTHKTNSLTTGIHFSVNNLLNQVYEVMPYYATPLRNYNLTLRFEFN